MIEISIYLRVLLVLGSISTAAFILKRIRQAKVQIEDCIFWLFFAAFLLLLSIFPEVASWISRLLEFESPINLVYLLIIFVLLVHQFSMTVRISQMDFKLRTLAQKVALNERDQEEHEAAHTAQPGSAALGKADFSSEEKK